MLSAERMAVAANQRCLAVFEMLKKWERGYAQAKKVYCFRYMSIFQARTERVSAPGWLSKFSKGQSKGIETGNTVQQDGKAYFEENDTKRSVR